MSARHPASGTVTAANGRAGEPVGRYLMEVVFPEAGDWTVEFGLQQLVVAQANPTTVNVGESPTDEATGNATIDAAASECA